jgi:hypothetical protein
MAQLGILLLSIVGTAGVRMRVLTVWIAALAALAAAAGAGHAGPYKVPRNAFGQPDLEGLWSSMSMTRLERPPGAPLTFPTKAQEEAYEAQRRAAIHARRQGDVFGQNESEWQEEFPLARIDGRLRTSWIVSPADGQLPYRPEARQRLAEINAGQATRADGPEDRSVFDRCLAGGAGAAGPPIQNPFTTSGGTQIVQTGGEIAILAEMNHDVRIVRLDARHQPPAMRQWMGDSVGWWEGHTLVVETTHFHPQEGFRAQYLLSPGARVTERFRRVSPTELRYTFEVDDPATYTQPWRGEMPLLADKGPIYEYACHEGNYSLANILQGARQAERDAQAAKATSP